MKKDDKTLCNFWLPNEIYVYLKLKSKKEYKSMTNYVVQMLVDDMKKEQNEK